MAGKSYVGMAGHLAVMSELALRGYNVAIPEIDVGDDIFAVNDQTGGLWRIQVKTSNEKRQRTSSRFQFRVRRTAILNAANPDLHFVFVLRRGERWRFAVVERAVLRNYVTAQNVGTQNGDYQQINMTLHDAGNLVASGVGMTHHLEDWTQWPPI